MLVDGLTRDCVGGFCVRFWSREAKVFPHIHMISYDDTDSNNLTSLSWRLPSLVLRGHGSKTREPHKKFLTLSHALLRKMVAAV